MIQARFLARRVVWLGGSLVLLLTVPFTACKDGGSLASSESPLPPSDSTAPPADTLVPPPLDTTTPPPPPDTTPPPPPSPDCGVTGGSSGTPVHSGLPFGPAHSPPATWGPPFSGTIHTATTPGCLLAELDAARRGNTQIFLNFTGNEQYLRDANGFSLTQWKQRVDRYRGVDITSYIADGTILGHFILDEPSDPSNWSGKQVALADIEEMARYSKEIWPSMATMIRAWPDYLKGYQWKSLDAVRFHYLEKFGPIDDFIALHVGDAESLGLKVVGGLNVLNGGSKSSGIPGRGDGKNAMSADEIRTWGTRFLSEPDICAFFLWQWDPAYLARPDIKAAVEDLAAKARNYPQKSCKR